MARILVVDDAPLVLESLSNALASRGHTVVVAPNGVVGMRKFTEESFDLVITDIIMPEKEGIQLIMEMRRKTPDIKIIAISGGDRTANVEYLNMASKLGADAILAKPVRLAEFYRVVDSCLGIASGE
jgi:CheY-like chemotaxis protein